MHRIQAILKSSRWAPTNKTPPPLKKIDCTPFESAGSSFLGHAAASVHDVKVFVSDITHHHHHLEETGLAVLGYTLSRLPHHARILLPKTKKIVPSPPPQKKKEVQRSDFSVRHFPKRNYRHHDLKNKMAALTHGSARGCRSSTFPCAKAHLPVERVACRTIPTRRVGGMCIFGKSNTAVRENIGIYYKQYREHHGRVGITVRQSQTADGRYETVCIRY